ncbi:MAG: MFS transporter, partial [Actinomycetota bacterium]|nr:MFS transporter [Actinomycetota bacterium]
MRVLIRTPGVLPLFGASLLARLPMGALGLLLILHTQELTGSYARGGLAAGAYALALGVSNPALARVVDRRGQTLVLRVGAPVSAAAIAGVALLPAGAPAGLIVVLAVLSGAAQPPIGSCMRALWPTLVDGPDARHVAYSLESAALELVYICGPVVIVAGVGSLSVPAALLVCAATEVAGNLAFSAHPASRAWAPALLGPARD